MNVIGITGPNASGKGTVVAHLHARGFDVFSLSDVIRDELRRRELPTDRSRMTETGEALRRRFGAGVLAERLLPKLTDRCVVDSIRHPGEVDVLRTSADHFLLLGVDAPPAVREQRLRHRARPGDTHHTDAFQREEAAQNTEDPEGQKIRACLALADIVLLNDGTLEALYEKVDEALARHCNAW